MYIFVSISQKCCLGSDVRRDALCNVKPLAKAQYMVMHYYSAVFKAMALHSPKSAFAGVKLQSGHDQICMMRHCRSLLYMTAH